MAVGKCRFAFPYGADRWLGACGVAHFVAVGAMGAASPVQALSSAAWTLPAPEGATPVGVIAVRHSGLMAESCDPNDLSIGRHRPGLLMSSTRTFRNGASETRWREP